jgi:hypothetical protein
VNRHKIPEIRPHHLNTFSGVRIAVSTGMKKVGKDRKWSVGEDLLPKRGREIKIARSDFSVPQFVLGAERVNAGIEISCSPHFPDHRGIVRV